MKMLVEAPSGAVSACDRKAEARDVTILVVCTTHRDIRELPLLARSGTKYVFHDYGSAALEELIAGKPESALADPLSEIDHIVARAREAKADAIVSSDDYPGSALAAAAAQALGLKAPDPAVTLIAQHKYLSRLAQRRYAPEAVPAFAELDVADGSGLPKELAYPVFVKPIKSFFSVGAGVIANQAELRAVKRDWLRRGAFFAPLERLLGRYAGIRMGTRRLIAEGLLKGAQVTVEGYVAGGEATIIGIVDSVFYAGTLAFSRFEYPSSLPLAVQDRMADVASRVVRGIGFDDGMFNIEMMYDADADKISIIEINPRMASQFADLYEKVDGYNSYGVMLDIALGRKPELRWREGRHRVAASCVLRTFQDCVVAAVPSEQAMQALRASEPDLRIELHATLGRKLSAELQDGHSFRYGVLNLGGADRSDVLRKFARYRDSLSIVLTEAPAANAHDIVGHARPATAVSGGVI